MLTEDELPAEAKVLLKKPIRDPVTGKKIWPRKWVHDPTTGEFYELVSLQPSGPELARYSYGQRLEGRIQQEKNLKEDIKSLVIKLFGVTLGLCFLYWWYLNAPAAFIIIWILGMPFFVVWPGLFINLLDNIMMLRNPKRLIDIGPKPIKKFNLSDFLQEPEETGEGIKRSTPPSSDNQKPWDVGR